jgi:hypothetical protein
MRKRRSETFEMAENGKGEKGVVSCKRWQPGQEAEGRKN